MHSRRFIVIATAVLTLAAPSAALAATITGTDGADKITGTTGADTISGRDGNDDITGLGGVDELRGGVGFDFISIVAPFDRAGGTVYGGPGPDVVASQSFHSSYGNTIDCGDGDDVVFSDELGFGAPPATTDCEHVILWRYGTKDWGYSPYRDAPPRPDSKLVRGTNDADRLMGTKQAENMIAGAGNDMLFGNIKPDSPAPDLLAGGAGDDLIDTGDNRGVNYTCYEANVQNCDTTTPTYRADGRLDVEYVYAGTGDDIIIARAASMVIDCGPGYDIVYAAGALERNDMTGCEEFISMA